MASSNVFRRNLGAKLRELRDEAGKTQDEVAERFGWSRAKVSYVESGQGAISDSDLREFFRFYEVAESRRAELLALARRARSRVRRWWNSYDDVLPLRFGLYLAAETEASALSIFEATLVPGLLQTTDYAEAVIRAANPTESDEEVGRRLEVRMQRKARLAEEHPPRLWAVLDEAVLHRAVGGRDVMEEQLRYLAHAARLPNVTLQVLPYGVGGHVAMTGAFVLLEFGPDDPPMVYLEYRTGSLIMEDRQEVAEYTLMVNHLRVRAADEDRSIRMITRAAEGG